MRMQIQIVTEEMLLTPLAKTLLCKSVSIAKSMGHSYIGPRHIAMAVFTSDLGEAELLFKALGVDLDSVSSKVKALLDPKPT